GSDTARATTSRTFLWDVSAANAARQSETNWSRSNIVTSLFKTVVQLHHRKFRVLPVGDEHAARIMRDAEFWLHRCDHRLGRNSAGPEHRQLVITHFDHIAIVGLADVLDADHLRLADVHRRAVHRWKAR